MIQQNNYIAQYIPHKLEAFLQEREKFERISSDYHKSHEGPLDPFRMIHDYGCYAFPGANKAVDEFFAPKGITPHFLSDRFGSAVVVKSSL